MTDLSTYVSNSFYAEVIDNGLFEVIKIFVSSTIFYSFAKLDCQVKSHVTRTDHVVTLKQWVIEFW